jgi:imidazolonepropionase-like amidohydrolase
MMQPVRVLRLVIVALGLVALYAGPVAAQDLAITNARIVVGNGQVINSGTIVVRGGKIVSASAGAAATQGLRVVDAKGMSAVPGFIDAHKHVNTGPQEKEQMQGLLEAGYTTILSGGGPGDGNITLRDRIEAGTTNGPRIIPSERVNLRGTPDEARAAIRAMAAKGIKHTGEIALTPLPGPTAEEIAVLKAVVDEAAKAGVQVNVHAVSTPAMVAAVDAGVRRLVHLPNKDFTSHEAAAKVAKSGAIALGTVGFGAPIFGVFASDNNPRFRDGKPWPEAIAGANRDAAGRALGTEAAYAMMNARTIWDNGGLIGYCTDTNYEPLAGLEHELKSYSIVFSMQDIFKLMGPNTAAYIGMADQLGTLEAGKLADIVLLDGNPMDGIHNMLKTKVVVKGGKVVVDKR